MRIVIEFNAKNNADLIRQLIEFLSDVPAATGATTDIPAPTAQPAAAAPAITLDEVRGHFSDLVRGGKAEAAKSILKQLGADNISSLAPKDYAEAIRLAETA